MMASSNGRLTVISLVGYQGSGKSTLAKKLARSLGTVYIETSDVVRDLTGVVKRSKLPDTTSLTKDKPNWLTSVLAKRLQEGAKAQDSQYAVLCGVRESSVHSSLLRRRCALSIYEITADPWVRYQRVRSLSKVDSVEDFLEHELRERAMGLNKTISKAQHTVTTSPTTDADQLAAVMKKRIFTKDE